eukprot:5698206-Pleurochrysis_carterae.AAC.1
MRRARLIGSVLGVGRLRLQVNSVGEISSGCSPAFPLRGGRSGVQVAWVAVLRLDVVLVVAKHLPAGDRVNVSGEKPALRIARVRFARVVSRKLVRLGDVDEAADVQPADVVLGQPRDVAIAGVAVVIGALLQARKLIALLGELGLHVSMRKRWVIEDGASMSVESDLEVQWLQVANATQSKHGV